jgi:hypothetical protein
MVCIGIGAEVQYEPAAAHIFEDMWSLNHGIVGRRLIAVFKAMSVYLDIRVDRIEKSVKERILVPDVRNPLIGSSIPFQVFDTLAENDIHLIPGDARPSAFTPWANSFHGIEQPFWIIRKVDSCHSFGTYSASIVGVIGISEYLDELAAVEVGDDAASCRTLSARRGDRS